MIVKELLQIATWIGNGEGKNSRLFLEWINETIKLHSSRTIATLVGMVQHY